MDLAVSGGRDGRHFMIAKKWAIIYKKKGQKCVNIARLAGTGVFPLVKNRRKSRKAIEIFPHYRSH